MSNIYIYTLSITDKPPMPDKVTAIKKNGRKYQLLLATGISNANTSETVYVLKALKVGQLGSNHVKTHLEWMWATDGAEGYAHNIIYPSAFLTKFYASRTQLLDDFRVENIHYMVFPKRNFTLRDVLNDQSLMPLPAQHVQEISFQLVNAVRRKSPM